MTVFMTLNIALKLPLGHTCYMRLVVFVTWYIILRYCVILSPNYIFEYSNDN